jgi:hypothetical protein
LKEELPELLRQARVPFDFSSVPGAAKYDASLARKLKRKADKAASTPSAAAAAASDDEGDDDESDDDDDDDDEGDDEGDDEDDVVKAATRTAARVIDAEKWEADPIERARRILEWWKARVKGVTFFKYWPLALRLVVLVQPSSAFVERVFSQIKLIIEQIGVESRRDHRGAHYGALQWVHQVGAGAQPTRRLTEPAGSCRSSTALHCPEGGVGARFGAQPTRRLTEPAGSCRSSTALHCPEGGFCSVRPLAQSASTRRGKRGIKRFEI